MYKAQDHKWFFIIVFGSLFLTLVAQNLVSRYSKARRTFFANKCVKHDSRPYIYKVLRTSDTTLFVTILNPPMNETKEIPIDNKEWDVVDCPDKPFEKIIPDPKSVIPYPVN